MKLQLCLEFKNTGSIHCADCGWHVLSHKKPIALLVLFKEAFKLGYFSAKQDMENYLNEDLSLKSSSDAYKLIN